MSEHRLTAEWLRLATQDYDVALFLWDTKYPKPLEIICYHCQQAIEKSLKAFLCAHALDEIPRTHNTGFLCRLCAELDEAFSTFLVSCEEIAFYATHLRYPSHMEVGQHRTTKGRCQREKFLWSTRSRKEA